ncbi:MAG TPA: hypothetical protein VGM51_02140 [Armatimonadota bacterium]|jgi:hypothetical protein
MRQSYLLIASLVAILAAAPMRADETSDRLRHALTLARDGSMDEAVAAIPDAAALDRGNLSALQNLVQALTEQRPSAAAHLLAAMRRLDPDAMRPRANLESLWAANPSLDGLLMEDLPGYPIDAETTTVGGATIVTISPKPFVNYTPPIEPTSGMPYPLLVSAYVLKAGTLALRFTVHCADRVDPARARQVGRFLVALSDLTDPVLGAEIRAVYPVPVWISAEGAAGARQWRGAIHIEAANTPRSDIEWVRELTHEWGHAALPGIDGFTQPEAWANGDLGERLFLPLMDKSGRLSAWAPGVEAAPYAARYFVPLVTAFSRSGPDPRLLADKGRKGYEHFLGAALYVDGAYGRRILLEALDGAGGGSARDFLTSLSRVLAVRTAVEIRRGGAVGPLPICIPRSGRYILDGRAVRQLGRAVKSPITLSAGWTMIEWDGVLTVRRAEVRGAQSSRRGR